MKSAAFAAALAFLLACTTEPAPSHEPAFVETPPADDDAATKNATDAATPPEKPKACDPSVPRTTPLEVAVQPEAGVAPFVSVIDRAKSEIRVMVYQMGYGQILDHLEAKARAGVKVRVILDLAQQRTNQKYMDRLTAAGAEVIWSDPSFTFMHAKVIIADASEVIVSTGNYHESYMAKERNFAVRDGDPADVALLVGLFDADFARKTPDLSCTRLLVSPIQSKERLLAFIASAQREILVESMQFADRDVRDAIAARHAAGVDVRVLLADPEWIDANASAGTFLVGKGIPARHMKAPGVHAKAIAVDGERVYIGSINLSTTSLTKNREVGLIVTESENVAAVRSTFDKDWESATAF